MVDIVYAAILMMHVILLTLKLQQLFYSLKWKYIL